MWWRQIQYSQYSKLLREFCKQSRPPKNKISKENCYILRILYITALNRSVPKHCICDCLSVWYLFCKADISEALLNGIKLLFILFPWHNVLHHFAVLTVNVPADSCYDSQISFHIVRSEWWDYLHHKPGRCPIWQPVSLQLVLVVKAGIYVIEYVEIFLPSEGKTSRS